jgi:hypothetical protein
MIRYKSSSAATIEPAKPLQNHFKTTMSVRIAKIATPYLTKDSTTTKTVSLR